MRCDRCYTVQHVLQVLYGTIWSFELGPRTQEVAAVSLKGRELAAPRPLLYPRRAHRAPRPVPRFHPIGGCTALVLLGGGLRRSTGATPKGRPVAAQLSREELSLGERGLGRSVRSPHVLRSPRDLPYIA